MKTVLVTGSNGFIGRNLTVRLRELKDIKVKSFNIEDNLDTLNKHIVDSDFIFHIAGVNRPEKEDKFEKVNTGLTRKIIKMLDKIDKKIPIVITSSIYAKLENPYGKSKKMAEDELINYANKNYVPVYIYRLPNVFGKWSKPNYNSVVATFCYNISHNLDIYISDPLKEIELVYIDDVISEFISLLTKKNIDFHKYYYTIERSFKITLQGLADRIYQIKKNRNNFLVPDLSDLFTKFLQATYLSYLDKNDFSYPLQQKDDNRGSFVEVIKSNTFGQISISKSYQNITRGNHYHHTKYEKFIVIKGSAIIKLRNLFNDEITTYYVSDKKLEVVDIPPGYTHSIKNITHGDGKMILLIWANEVFNPENPDTYQCEV